MFWIFNSKPVNRLEILIKIINEVKNIANNHPCWQYFKVSNALQKQK